MKITALVASIVVLAAEAVVVQNHHHHLKAPVDKDTQKFIDTQKKEDARLGRLSKSKTGCSKIKDGHKRFLCKQKAYDKAIEERGDDDSMVQFIDFNDDETPANSSLIGIYDNDGEEEID